MSFNPDEYLEEISSVPIQSNPSGLEHYDHIFEEASQAYDLDPNLLKAQAWAESNYNPNAVSHAGAKGIMQLMDGTAKELGVDDSFDPYQNIMGGALYMRQQIDAFGDEDVALGAYNAGPGAVRKYGGIPPYKETQAYIPRIRKKYRELLAKSEQGKPFDPEAYLAEMEPVDTTEFDPEAYLAETTPTEGEAIASIDEADEGFDTEVSSVIRSQSLPPEPEMVEPVAPVAPPPSEPAPQYGSLQEFYEANPDAGDLDKPWVKQYDIPAPALRHDAEPSEIERDPDTGLPTQVPLSPSEDRYEPEGVAGETGLPTQVDLGFGGTLEQPDFGTEPEPDDRTIKFTHNPYAMKGEEINSATHVVSAPRKAEGDYARMTGKGSKGVPEQSGLKVLRSFWDKAKTFAQVERLVRGMTQDELDGYKYYKRYAELMAEDEEKELQKEQHISQQAGMNVPTGMDDEERLAREIEGLKLVTPGGVSEQEIKDLKEKRAGEFDGTITSAQLDIADAVKNDAKRMADLYKKAKEIPWSDLGDELLISTFNELPLWYTGFGTINRFKKAIDIAHKAKNWQSIYKSLPKLNKMKIQKAMLGSNSKTATRLTKAFEKMGIEKEGLEYLTKTPKPVQTLHKLLTNVEHIPKPIRDMAGFTSEMGIFLTSHAINTGEIPTIKDVQNTALFLGGFKLGAKALGGLREKAFRYYERYKAQQPKPEPTARPAQEAPQAKPAQEAPQAKPAQGAPQAKAEPATTETLQITGRTAEPVKAKPAEPAQVTTPERVALPPGKTSERTWKDVVPDEGTQSILSETPDAPVVKALDKIAKSPIGEKTTVEFKEPLATISGKEELSEKGYGNLDPEQEYVAGGQIIISPTGEKRIIVFGEPDVTNPWLEETVTHEAIHGSVNELTKEVEAGNITNKELLDRFNEFRDNIVEQVNVLGLSEAEASDLADHAIAIALEGVEVIDPNIQKLVQVPKGLGEDLLEYANLKELYKPEVAGEIQMPRTSDAQVEKPTTGIEKSKAGGDEPITVQYSMREIRKAMKDQIPETDKPTAVISTKAGTARGYVPENATLGDLADNHDKLLNLITNKDSKLLPLAKGNIEHSLEHGMGTWVGPEPNFFVRFPKGTDPELVKDVGAMLGMATLQDAVITIKPQYNIDDAMPGAVLKRIDGKRATMEEVQELAKRLNPNSDEKGLQFTTQFKDYVLLDPTYFETAGYGEKNLTDFLTKVREAIETPDAPVYTVDTYKQEGDYVGFEDYKQSIEKIRTGGGQKGRLDLLKRFINDVYKPARKLYKDRGWKLPKSDPAYKEALSSLKEQQAEFKDVTEKKFKKIAPYLKDDPYAQKIDLNMKHDIIEQFSKILPTKDIVTMAKAGSAKMGWYKRSAKLFRRMFGLDTPRFIGITASTSPQTSVKENFYNALRLWNTWNEAGRPQTKAGFDKVKKDSGVPLDMEAWWGNSETVLLEPDATLRSTLSGLKVDSFSKNLLENYYAVTNDAWMLGALSLIKRGDIPKGLYLAMSAGVRKASKQLGWHPSEVQETVWSFFKTLTESVSGGKTVAQAMTEMTPEMISETPEFTTYMENPNDPKHIKITKQLDRLGLDEGTRQALIAEAKTDIVKRLKRAKEIGGLAEGSRAGTERIARQVREKRSESRLTKEDIKKRDDARKRDREKLKEYIKEKRGGDTKFSIRAKDITDKYTPAQKRVEKAVGKKFGFTKDTRRAGFMAPDGRMIDFGKGEGTGRAYLHDEGASMVVPGKKGWKAVESLMDMGYIRLSPRMYAGVSMNVRPTGEQVTSLFNYFSDSMDISPETIQVEIKPGGEFGYDMSLFYKEYDPFVSIMKIIRDVDRYFETGEVKPVSRTSQFREQWSVRKATPKPTDKQLDELASLQREKPEEAMLEVQHAYGGGVLNPVVEHVGDLIHRMAEKPTRSSAGYSYVKDKVDKTLGWLTNPYGFRKEMRENMKANRKYTEEGYDKRVSDALDKYAEEHKKLPVYNEVQELARESAVAVGEQRFDDAVKSLKKLKTYLDEGKDAWVERALGGTEEKFSVRKKDSKEVQARKKDAKDMVERRLKDYKVSGELPPPEMKLIEGAVEANEKASYFAEQIYRKEMPDEWGLLKAWEKEKDVWIGAKDVRILKSKSEKKRIQGKLKDALGAKKYTPKVQFTDMAIDIAREMEAFPGAKARYYNTLSNKQKTLVKIAEEMPKEVKPVVDELANAYKDLGEEALDMNVLQNLRENYASRVWEMDNVRDAVRGLFDKFGMTTKHALPRKFDTIIEGWASGYRLKVEGATNRLQIYKEELVRVLEDKKFMDRLRQIKNLNGQPLLTDQMLEGYAQVDHPNFKIWRKLGKVKEGKVYGKDTRITEDGTVLTKVPMYAPKEIAGEINNILGMSKLMEVPGVKAITKYNANIKAWVLQSSLFHVMAFLRSYFFGTNHKAFKDMNPVKAYKDGLKAIEMEHPVVMHGVRNGLTLDLRQDWEEDLLQSKTLIGKAVDQVPGAKQTKDLILFLRDAQANWLFGEMGAGLKAKSFLIEYKNMMKKRPNADPDYVAKSVAKLINEDFGGLHLQRMGRNPTLQHIFRLWLLAIDWTESNVRTMVGTLATKTPDGRWFQPEVQFMKRVAQKLKDPEAKELYNRLALEPGEKGLMTVEDVKAFREKTGFEVHEVEYLKAEAKLYRKFWAGVLYKTAIATILSNYLLSQFDDESFVDRYKKAWGEGKDWKKLRWTGVDITPLYKAVGGKGKERKYFSVPGHFIDLFKFAIKPVVSLHHKGSMLYRVFYEAMAGEDWAGRRFTTAKELMETGKLVTHAPGERGLQIENIPSYLGAQVRGSQPVQIQNLLSWIAGEQEGFDAIGKSVGLRISTTYKEEKKAEKRKKEREKESKTRYKTPTSRYKRTKAKTYKRTKYKR